MTTEAEFTGTPTAVYRLYAADGTLLYVGITGNLVQRMLQHQTTQPWWPLVARKTMAWYGSLIAAMAAEAAAIHDGKPRYNVLIPAVDDHAPPHGQRQGWHRTPLLAWHPPPELAAWAREEAERRGGGRGALSDLLTEALAEKRQRIMDPLAARLFRTAVEEYNRRMAEINSRTAG